MTKRILYFFIIALLLFVASYFTHQYIITNKNINLTYPLLNVYVFHTVAAIIVYNIVEFVAEKMPNQAGYSYLASIFLKIGFFVLLFKDSVFTNDALTKPERVSLVIPLFLFLITEAIAVSKLLNSK